MSVITTFDRFLKIAKLLEQKVAVITDTDDLKKLEKLKNGTYYKNAKDCKNVKICFVENYTSDKEEKKIIIKNNTLEAYFLEENSLDSLNKIFDKNFDQKIDLQKYMQNNKTEWALKIFDTEEEVNFPEYINNAIEYITDDHATE